MTVCQLPVLPTFSTNYRRVHQLKFQSWAWKISRLSVYHLDWPRTTDTQWSHKSKISEKLGRCGRQNMLRPYLKIWGWDWEVKAIFSLGVRSPWKNLFWKCINVVLVLQLSKCYYLVYAEMLFRVFRDYLRYFCMQISSFCPPILSEKKNYFHSFVWQKLARAVLSFCIKDKICRFCLVGIGR